MIVGFTGTRKGMSDHQRSLAFRLLTTWQPEVVHHGDCIGADEEFADLAFSLGIEAEVHPPSNDRYRAFRTGVTIHKPAPYLDRNRHIVEASTRLIATPGEFVEQVRSGTWSTVRYAQKIGRPVWVLYPNGAVEER